MEEIPVVVVVGDVLKFRVPAIDEGVVLLLGEFTQEFFLVIFDTVSFLVEDFFKPRGQVLRHDIGESSLFR